MDQFKPFNWELAAKRRAARTAKPKPKPQPTGSRTFVLVDQVNHSYRREDGTRVLTYKTPITMAEVEQHIADGSRHYRIVKADRAPIEWGRVTYEAKPDGSLAYVGDDCDSSG